MIGGVSGARDDRFSGAGVPEEIEIEIGNIIIII